MGNIVSKTIDKRYENGKIYTIVCDDGAVYVGSTIRTLNDRLASHRTDKTCCMYKYIYKSYDGDWSKCKIELYELYSCNNKKELWNREGKIIQLIGTINKKIAGRTRKEYEELRKDEKKIYFKEYRKKNKEILQEKNIQYREDNKEKLQNYERNRSNKNERLEKQKETIECDCGCISTRKHLPRHQRTPKHQELILNQTTAILSFLECF